jgi:hypothetical protein
MAKKKVSKKKTVKAKKVESPRRAILEDSKHAHLLRHPILLGTRK